MKKNIIFSLSLLAAAASFGSSVESDNIFGVLKIATAGVTNEETVIGVPWVAVGTGGSSINISDLVLTSNLLKGDQLYYYDSSEQKFEVWELNSSKVWEPKNSVTGLTSDKVKTATTTTLPRGSALIVKFSGGADGRTDSSIYLSGQYAALGDDGVTTTLSLTTSANSIVWNLIAPPSVSSYDINSATFGFEPTVGDAIVTNALPSSWIRYKQVPNQEYYRWGRVVDYKNEYNIITGKVFQVEAEVAPGVGAWYRATGVHSEDESTITWK